ncbi:hypothetical protein KOR34_07100 [Posidoniimonas corsicana]|uniref:Uncharacterized protein n=1 Tax=Posidoniimonas corsicana TaxID=1938618 RepID=A0A5C5VB16_9BACT|nr:hypothetical protein [Posidoniimonas corsicana]TWT35816.1 hypothetical protein KOR34_07100 [Posidoniimonas corsicana]
MNDWYEVWADGGLYPPYLLLLQKIGNTYDVVDPQEGGNIVFHAEDYESAKQWLLEDEYEKLNGIGDG